MGQPSYLKQAKTTKLSHLEVPLVLFDRGKKGFEDPQSIDKQSRSCD